MRKSIGIAAFVAVSCFSMSSVVAGTISGTITAKGVRHPGDTVVYIGKEGVTESFQPPTEHPTMDQKNLTFIPHVMPVLVGTTVDFLNSDSILHNVFTPDKVADKFNLGTYPQGVVKTYTFTKPGDAVLLCNVHPEMEAYIVVVETPWFAVSDKQGAYTIADVPAGNYVLKTWHHKLKSQTSEVTVSSDGETVADFGLSGRKRR